jgi:hypothetical protein
VNDTGRDVPPGGDSCPGRGDFVFSLGLLVVLTGGAVIGLLIDGNRPKALRVGLATATYVTVLLAWHGVRASMRRSRSRVPFLIFVAAGCGAGLVSGLVRPDPDPAVVAAQVAGAGMLLGAFHWLALRAWRVYDRIVTSGRP